MTIDFSRKTEFLRDSRVKTNNLSIMQNTRRELNETKLNWTRQEFIEIEYSKTRQKLNEIRLNIVALTTRHRAKRNMRVFNDEIQNVKFFDDLMSIIDQIKRFSNKKMIFSIHIIFEKRKIVSIIQFEIDDVIYVSDTFIIFDDDEFSKLLNLIEQRIDNHMIQKNNMKNWMNLHWVRKFEFNDQEIVFENTFDEKKTHVTII